MKFGLRNIRVLLDFAGNPERKFRSIHVAGTNGKGSTSSFIASILMESGLRTGLYTSPHLVRFSERIRIDGSEIDEERIVSYALRLIPVIEKTRATFFEATTCIAFQYFADEGVDVAVIETGLGGRLDATNVLMPVVSVITSISLDHTDVLGHTIGAIAKEKGGIIKRDIPCTTSSRDPVALRALDRIAARRGTRVRRAASMLRIHPVRKGNKSAIRLSGRNWITRSIVPGLDGSHQQENARLAASAYEIFAQSEMNLPRNLKLHYLERGLSRVTANTGLRGRREMTILRGTPIMFDVAHNPDGIKALVESLRHEGRRKYVVLFGAMRDKAVEPMLASLEEIAAQFVFVTPSTTRALPGRRLYELMLKHPVPVRFGGTVRNGFRHSLRLVGPKTPLLVTGSHYVVGEVLALLEGK